MIKLHITPQATLVDEPLAIQVSGLEPGETVTLSASLVDLQGMQWAAQARFRADPDGALDLARVAPLDGSYDWPDAMGLVWSMRLADEQQPLVGFITLGIEPYIIHFHLETASGTVIENEVTRIWMKDRVKRQVVREDGLFGTLFLPPGAGPHPSLILVNGSDGGLNESLAALFASRGFATLALAYFNYEGRPRDQVNIPLEYFETAIHFLQAHPQIDGEKLGVTGPSLGGELSLLLGATFPQLRAVAAYVPSGVVWGGFFSESGEPCAAWTWKGEPLAYVPEDPGFNDSILEMIEKHIPIPCTPVFLLSLERASPQALEAATIPVEKTNGAVLLVSGEDDQMWPSSYMSNLVMERLARKGFPHFYHHLSYPNVGHLIGIIAPTGPMPPSHILHPVNHTDYAVGGTLKANVYATIDSWRQVLQFFRKYLK